MASYPFNEIEQKWQSFWELQEIYKITENADKPKYYILDMFPYPSGAGLHIGHPEGYTATDILGRYKRMKGYNVLHPMGFDAFGLPTERYCMEKGIHPIDATNTNIAVFRKQLKMLGLGYDWSREINTTSPEYYKWTQWMFLKIYNSWYDESKGKARPIEELPIPENIKSEIDIMDYQDQQRLAYIAMIPVNWCEQLGTVLANEEVDEWREKGYTVERRPMRQYMIRITKYAKRLLDDLQFLNWPHSTKEMQRNWIGESVGAEVKFKVDAINKDIIVFTTRPDTLFGATYMVLAPEHEMVKIITNDENKTNVEEFIKSVSQKSDLERTELNKEKKGVFTGAYAINPVNSEKIPIWIADYVLAHYGTGAIMAVPGHDERDHEFAKKYELSIVQVVLPNDTSEWDTAKNAFTEDGLGCNSSNSEVSLNGLTTEIAKKTIIKWLNEKNLGEMKIQYKLRDWLFSRQRYWGEPIPIMYFEDGTRRSLDESELPLILPDVIDFKPAGTGESPLAKIDSWVNFIDKKTGKKARYETNTMPQWAGSCWYYLRYMDPHNKEVFCSSEIEKYWMQPDGIDLYVGGAEHAVLHLLYARFWHKVLYDYGYVSTFEPFKRMFHQGLILGEMEYTLFVDENNEPISSELVRSDYSTSDSKMVTFRKLQEADIVKIKDKSKEYHVWKENQNIKIDARVFKMSKSRGNVINPDDVIEKYGTDSLRVFEMFLGPLEDSKPWSDKGIEGVNRFLNRLWRMLVTEENTLSANVQDIELTPEQDYQLNYTIKKISEDIENLRFNTAVSQMMIFVNEFMKSELKPRKAMELFVLSISPFAPHIAEELWRFLGHNDSIVLQPYPSYDESKCTKSQIEFVVQVNSKIRGKINLPADLNKEDYEKLALADENVQKYIENNQVKKVIYVPNKLINFIV